MPITPKPIATGPEPTRFKRANPVASRPEKPTGKHARRAGPPPEADFPAIANHPAMSPAIWKGLSPQEKVQWVTEMRWRAKAMRDGGAMSYCAALNLIAREVGYPHWGHFWHKESSNSDEPTHSNHRTSHSNRSRNVSAMGARGQVERARPGVTEPASFAELPTDPRPTPEPDAPVSGDPTAAEPAGSPASMAAPHVSARPNAVVVSVRKRKVIEAAPASWSTPHQPTQSLGLPRPSLTLNVGHDIPSSSLPTQR